MLLRNFTLLGEWDGRPSVQDWNVILLARVSVDLASSMNSEREVLVLVLTAFKRLCLNVFPVLLQHTICYSMVCVAVCVYKLISGDYTVNGQHLALCLNSFGMLNVLSLYCILFLLPYVVLTVLYVVACIYSFWHCCFSPRSQTTAASYSLHLALSNKHFFSGVAWCFCILCDSWGVQGWCLCPGYIMWPSAEWCCWVFWRRWGCWSGWDQWHCARLVAHVQFPPQKRSCLQRLCGMWQSLQLSEAWGLTSGLYDQDIWPSLLQLLCSFWVTHGVPILLHGPGKSGSKERLINNEKCALQNLAFEGWRWGTNVFASVISGQCLVLFLWSVRRRWKS